MARFNDCDLPEDLFYLVEQHVWARPETEGVVTVGVTDVFQSQAERIMFYTPRRVGKVVERGVPLAVVESGKWLGMIPSPVAGEIIEDNMTLVQDPNILNRDPYGQGWVARIRVADWALEQIGLVTGEKGLAIYRDFLIDAGIRCGERKGTLQPG